MRSILCFVLPVLFLSCDQTGEDKNAGAQPTFIHNVYFYFNDTVDIKLAKDFKNGLDKLSTVSSIYKVTYGPPAMTPRAVVDNDYDYAYLVEFLNKEDHDAYQDDPIHLAFIEKYKSLWKEVKVYDNIVQNQIIR